MTPPDQDRLNFLLGARILQPQFLSDREPLRHNRQAPFRADIHRIPLHLVRRSAFFPFQLQLHARIHSRSCSHVLQHPQCIVHFARSTHVHSSCHNLAIPRQFPTLRTLTSSVNGPYDPEPPISHHPRPPNQKPKPSSRTRVLCRRGIPLLFPSTPPVAESSSQHSPRPLCSSLCALCGKKQRCPHPDQNVMQHFLVADRWSLVALIPSPPPLPLHPSLPVL